MIIPSMEQSWQQYHTTKKANNTLAFLKRNITSRPTKIKAQCYTTLIRPIMEYACVVWDPVAQQNIYALEIVQRRAARFTFGDYRTTSSVTNMLHGLNWNTLEERRKRAKVIMLYRIIHQTVAIPSQPYLIPRGASSNTRGHQHRFQVPYSRLQCISSILSIHYQDLEQHLSSSCWGIYYRGLQIQLATYSSLRRTKCFYLLTVNTTILAFNFPWGMEQHCDNTPEVVCS